LQTKNRLGWMTSRITSCHLLAEAPKPKCTAKDTPGWLLANRFRSELSPGATYQRSRQRRPKPL